VTGVARGLTDFFILDFGGKKMDAGLLSNELNRSVKLAIDTGEANTLEEARKIFERYRLCVNVGPDVAFSPTLQAILLTAVNTGRRCFLGGVDVTGCPDANLLIPWRQCRTLAEAVTDLQGKLTSINHQNYPHIVIGDGEVKQVKSEFAIRATFEGWQGGVTPLDGSLRLKEQQEFTPTGVLAGALAVAEAFQFIRKSNPMAGRRATGLSLWCPEAEGDWLNSEQTGPDLEWLPARLWLIGLGHLGQAYLWTLGFLPYDNPSEMHLILQDYDTLTRANDSTSLLTTSHLIGQKKARAMAEWCEGRGFHTKIQERRFAANFCIDNEEPRVALCGVDNMTARAALEDVGFAQIIEAGLGKGTDEYLAFQMHCFPSTRAARSIWDESSNTQLNDALTEKPAYQNLANEGMDKCGLTTLSGRSVGASFVGAVASAIVISELLRMCIGEQRYDVIDGSLRSLDYRAAIPSTTLKMPFNPGLTKAIMKR
jgi:hypothetical protein